MKWLVRRSRAQLKVALILLWIGDGFSWCAQRLIVRTEQQLNQAGVALDVRSET